MKNYIKHNLIALLIVVTIVFIVEFLVSMPWWSFVVPVVFLGAILSYFKWQINSFQIGFIAGFLLWSFINYFLHLNGNGIVLTKIGLFLSSSTVIVVLVSGVIGGLLVGLALYTGTKIINVRNIEIDDKKFEL
ncbi:hypothetical protein EV200_106334 [Pedobacter psychrotolerans]|uniref:Uncharacterized protein n=1 Tax=Pedobacter psychrotolerans TaxID=1843235 RepID=A0A4R2H8P1_9SPHI|nr:hypothetical protein [Pedobacter psychrotolerans]TCO22689.1 hypothetical protein EV200_106334 [Pedobacter psychrotolerans]GGE66397.1 hypothetical protein GCM10011413_36180 [Pedobacter psychrotolerans]